MFGLASSGVMLAVFFTQSVFDLGFRLTGGAVAGIAGLVFPLQVITTVGVYYQYGYRLSLRSQAQRGPEITPGSSEDERRNR